MIWPHEPGFRGRLPIATVASLWALVSCLQRPDVTARMFAVGVVVAAAVATILFFYVAWIGRIDARFRHVFPRKFRWTSLLGFYGFGSIGVGLAIIGPWLAIRDTDESTAELMVYYFAVPCALAAAAGVYRVMREFDDISR